MQIPSTLIIMDGFGLSDSTSGNAAKNALTPNLDALMRDNPNTWLSASGEDVGLPDGQIGNSEVGHTNIGAGRVVYQDLPKISRAIADKSFFEKEALLAAMQNCRDNSSKLHIFGLMSDGGVHSHNTHIFALLEMAKMQGLSEVFLHCFMDGRDVSPTSGLDFIRECEEKCKEIGIGKISTIIGRFYAMDRDTRWDRVEKAYEAIVFGRGNFCEDPVKAVQDSYDAGLTDEFILPTVCCEGGTVSENDSVIFSNFRPDRAREITRSFVDPEFDGFEREYFKVHYVCMTQYDAAMPNVSIVFPHERIENSFGEYLSSLHFKQLRIAETEKYAHVTFFFNGGVEDVFEGEDRVLIASPREYPTYDLIPEMSAYAVTEEACKRIKSGIYDMIIINLANCDMVGHTGFYDAAVKAAETVDACVGQLVAATADMGGISVITADHGNCEKMTEEDGSPNTAHTTNPVPFIVCGPDVKLCPGRLCDIAPTILDLLGLDKPPEMSGKSLIQR